MKHTASKRFWHCLSKLPGDVQDLAHKNYALLKADPSHPSLQFKVIGARHLYSVRVGLHYRALGVGVERGVHWFWVGTHGEYDKLLGS